jgi:carbon monoxide dehydrogenase subunit G
VRVITVLLALFVPAVAWGDDLPTGKLSDDDVAVEYRDGTYFSSLSLRVVAQPAQVLEVLTDFEHMADFVPNLIASRVVSRSGNVYRIHQQGNAVFGPFSFPFESERRIEWFPEGRLVAQALSGSTKYMRSELRYQGVAGGTRIDYRMEVIPDRWIPSGMGVNLMRHELAEQFSALAREIARRQNLRQHTQH